MKKIYKWKLTMKYKYIQKYAYKKVLNEWKNLTLWNVKMKGEWGGEYVKYKKWQMKGEWEVSM